MDKVKVINNLLENIKSGNVPWHKPWKTFIAYNYIRKTQYSFLNSILLGEPGGYLTFKQIQDNGFKLKKGSKARYVIIYKDGSGIVQKKEIIEKVEEDENESSVKSNNIQFTNKSKNNTIEIITQEKIKTKYMSSLGVYPITSLVDAPPDDYKQIGPLLENFDIMKNIEKVLDKLNVKVLIGDNACVNIKDRIILMPHENCFDNEYEYIRTLLHEICHIILCQIQGIEEYVEKKYSLDELTVELATILIMLDYGILSEDDKSFDNSIAYCNYYYKLLADNPDNLFKAERFGRKIKEEFVSVELEKLTFK